MHKGPVFLKFGRRGTTPFDDLFTVFIDGVVHERGEDVHSHEILPAFLPGFRYLNRPYGNVVQIIDTPLTPQALTLML